MHASTTQFDKLGHGYDLCFFFCDFRPLRKSISWFKGGTNAETQVENMMSK